MTKYKTFHFTGGSMINKIKETVFSIMSDIIEIIKEEIEYENRNLEDDE